MCPFETLSVQPTGETADERSVEERADRHVRRLAGFYAHLAAFVGVNAMLVGINLLTSPGVFWAVWPILGWGVKVVAHAGAVFGLPGYADWKARARRRYIRRHADRPPVDRPEGTDVPAGETDELRRRVENLEAIVTSADWNLLTDVDSDAPADERADALAETVVPE